MVHIPTGNFETDAIEIDVKSLNETGPHSKLKIAHPMAFVLAALAAVAFAAPALLTGAPLMFFGDSASYYHQADVLVDVLGGADPRGTPLSLSRSIFYSLFVSVGYIVSPVWGVVVLQVAVLWGVLVWLGGLASGPGADAARLRAWLLAAAAVSSAPWFASLIMPDLFAGLVGLAMAALITNFGRLARLEVVALAILTPLAVAMHDSLLPLLFALAACAFLPGLAPDSGPQRRRLRALVLGICAAAAVLSMLNARALERVGGVPPVRLPFLAAHLIDMGPGRIFLETQCPEAGYALCAYTFEPDVTWEQVLFGREPGRGAYGLADGPTRAAMDAEQIRFALDVLRHHPGETASGLLADGLRQLGRFSLTDLTPNSAWDVYVATLPRALQARYADYAPVHDRDTTKRALAVVSGWILAVTLAAIVAGIWAATRLVPAARAGDPVARRALMLAGLIVAAVIFNGLICGVLASPYDRFQARVIWLIPVAAAVLLAALPRRRAPPPG